MLAGREEGGVLAGGQRYCWLAQCLMEQSFSSTLALITNASLTPQV